MVTPKTHHDHKHAHPKNTHYLHIEIHIQLGHSISLRNITENIIWPGHADDRLTHIALRNTMKNIVRLKHRVSIRYIDWNIIHFFAPYFWLNWFLG